MTAAVLAIDGGNSKTDVVLVDRDGSLLARVRGPSSSPHQLGEERAFALLDDLVAQAVAAAGSPAGPGAGAVVAEVAGVYLAGADYPREVTGLQVFLDARAWAPQAYVENDTFALLRTGTDSPDAVAVVCGAGINCVGVGADGAQVRFPALGRISGDWGGGFELGEEALWWAAREEDGRGPATSLTRAVAEHFGRSDASAVTEALHFGELTAGDLVGLAPAVLAAAAAGDAVARGIVDRLAEEVALLATTALRRLGLLDRPATVVLGGGVIAGSGAGLVDAIGALVHASAPRAALTVVTAPPVLGAALAGLDRLGAPASAGVRLRAAFAG